MDRRELLATLTASGLTLVSLGKAAAAGDALSAQTQDSAAASGAQRKPTMAYTLPDLPYPYDALEPFLNAETLHLHHDKHHAGYVNGLNETQDKLARAAAADDFSGIRALCDSLAFNYSGHVLHSIFWTNMSPEGGGQPNGVLGEQIARDFGSVDTFKAEFLAAANTVQGSGWGILGWQPLGERLVVLQAEKHQNLAQWGVTPLLVLDVWEHAYYLQYNNRRTEFTGRFLDVANWTDVAQRLADARA